MAVGPTLGTGLFLAGGQALAVGGPASLLISYISLSLLVYFMATSVAEVATYRPTRHGAIIMQGFQYLNESVGFATASLRWYTMAMFVPYELTTAMVSVGLWKPGGNIAVHLLLVTFAVVGMNMLSDRLFKSLETLLYRIKIGTLASLLVLSLSICLGGATGYDHWGFKYWKNPGALNEYFAHGPVGKFLGLLQCLHLSSIAFAFVPELVVHRVEMTETADQPEITNNMQPATRSNIPRRVLMDVFQTTISYTLSSLAMGVMAPYDDPLLTNTGAGAGLSPFVIGMYRARIRILPVTATLAILLSSLTSAQTFLHIASRSLYAMSDAGHVPSMFKIRNSSGVPWVAIVFTATFTTLAFSSIATSSSIMTTYFILFVNSSAYLSWMLSAVVYRRYRQHLRLHGATTAFRFSVQPFGTYAGLVISTLLLLSNGLICAVPGKVNGPRASRIIMAYLSIPLFCFLYLMHRFGGSISSPLHSKENSNKEVPDVPIIPVAPAGKYHSRERERAPHGRSHQPPTVIELDQVWEMAREE
ncbi:uncharacterized protein N7483_003238 [Penicillium malachiteum]|uniref:uncharacterized protein n=1 Tax=Penicillium malachiteum TaxID=1324776 RepID=UPI002547DDF3|nr:uncharacterized protein N7483_003238 [Penicillium malachiteum]KAJ5728730.1 hypothetical protein N7483_003238 [Penicillium malachiteum]